MLNWIINYVVGSFLSDYLEIDTSKTNTGFTTGKYVLENIKIKKDAFSKLNLPFFEIKNSFIGKISIELTKLMTLHPEDHPIIVIISDVFVNINQKGIGEWDEIKKLEELQTAKNLFLKNIEDFYSNYLHSQNKADDQKSSDFLKKIVNNLDFSVHNVIIRVEDDVSYPNNPYALALTLKSLKTQPNKDFQNQFKIHENAKQIEALVIDKVIVLDDFSLYMDIKEGLKDNDYINFITAKGRERANELKDYLENDEDEANWYAFCHSEIEDHLPFIDAHSYLLHNLDITFSVKFNQDYLTNHQEFIKCNLSIRNFDFYLSLQQLKVLLKVSAFITGIQSSYYYEIEEKTFKKEMDAETAEKYVRSYIDYFNLKHFQNKDETEFKNQKEILKTVEEYYKFDYLQKIRYLTYDKLKFLGKLNSLEREIEEKTPGIVSGFFASEETLIELQNAKKEKERHLSRKDEIDNKLDHYIKNLNNKEYIEKEIEDEKNLAKEKELKTLSGDYVKMVVRLVIENFKISLRTDKIFIKNPNYEDRTENRDYKYKYNSNKKRSTNMNNIYKENKPKSKMDQDEHLGFPGLNDQYERLFEENEKYIEDIIIINLKNLETLVLKGIDKTELYLFLGDIEILQFLSKHETFKKILESHYEKSIDEDIVDSSSLYQTDSAQPDNPNQNLKNNSHVNSSNTAPYASKPKFTENPRKRAVYNFEDNTANKYERDFDIKCGALFISFEMNPELPSSNMRLRLRNSKRLYVYLNVYCLQMLGFLLSEVLNSEMDFDNIAKNATEKSYQNIRKGYNKMKNRFVEGDYKPFAIHADIIVKSPRIVFPQDIISNKNRDCILISMGELTLKSHLANRIPSDKVINVRTLKYYGNLFDNYDINVNNFEVNVIYNFETLDKLNEYLTKDEKIYNKFIPIIEKLNMNVMLSQLIEPKNIYNDNFKVGIKIEEFVLNMNEQIVEFISNTLYCFKNSSAYYEFEITEIKKEPVYIKLTNVRNKNTIDPMIDYGIIDEKFDKAIGKKNKKTDQEVNEEKINQIEDGIMLKAKGGKQVQNGEKKGFMNKLNDKLTGQDEIEKLKKYEIEKRSKIREKILHGEYKKSLLDFNLIIESICLNFQKNISEEEKNLFSEHNIDIESKIIKPFFSISMIDYRINLTIYDDFGLNFVMAVEYFLIFDSESISKFEVNKITPKLILNSDFQFLFSSNRFQDEKIEPNLNGSKPTPTNNDAFINNSDRLNVKSTDILKIFKGAIKKNTEYIKKLNLYIENRKILESETSKKKNLIYLSMLMDKKTNTIKIKTFLNDLRLILNISTLARMKVYFMKLSDVYTKISSREIPLQKTLDRMKQEEKERRRQENLRRFEGLIKIPNQSNINNDKTNNDTNEKEIENVEEKNEARKNFLKKLKDRLKYRRENQGREKSINFQEQELSEIEKIFETLNKINQNGSNNELYFDNEMVKENKYLQSNSNEFKYVRNNYFYTEEKTKLKFILHINCIDIEVPLDAESLKTDMIFINFKLYAKFRSDSENQNIFEYDFGEKEILDFSISENLQEVMSHKDFKSKLKLVAKNFAKNDMNVNFMLNDFDVKIEKYVAGLLCEIDEPQKLISNLRLSGYFKKFIFISKKSYISNANVKIEPILIKISLSNLKVLQNYSDHFIKTLRLTDEKEAENEKKKQKELEQIESKEFEKFEKIPLDPLIEMANKQQFISSHRLPGENIKSKKSQMNIEKSDKHGLIAKGAKRSDELNEPKIKNLLETHMRKNLESRKIHPKIKKEKEIIFNIKDFNELFDIDITLEKFKAEIYDDLAIFVCNLLSLEVSNLTTKYISNTKPYDTENFSKFFIELISNNQAKDFNIYNMYFYLKLKLLLDVKVFNEKFYNWEPLAEPIEFNFSVHQIDKSGKVNCKILCEKMIDLNLSTNFVFTVNKLAKILKQNLEKKQNNNFFQELGIHNSRFYSGIKALESVNDQNQNNTNTKESKFNLNLRNQSNENAMKSPDLKMEKTGEKPSNAYSRMIANLKSNMLNGKKNPHGMQGKYLKFVNQTGMDLTCILLDKTEQSEICRFISGNGDLRVSKAEISNVYFETESYERKRFANNNLMKIYINELDFIVEGVDYTKNNISIFRIDSQNWKQPDYKLYEKITGSTRNKSNDLKIDPNKKSFYAEIHVKTKFSWNAKLIILESNIHFFNNTNHSIRLAFVKSGLITNQTINGNSNNLHIDSPKIVDENKNKKILNEKQSINNKPDNKNKSNSKNIKDLAEDIKECKTRNSLKIPLKYILLNYEVYMGSIIKKAKKCSENSNKKLNSNMSKIDYEYQEVFRLYTTSLKYIYVLGFDYVNMELENLKKEKKENYLKDLNQKYSSLITFEPDFLENENYAFKKTVISSDILLLKSDDDITYAGDVIDLKDKQELMEAKKKTYLFTVVLNPPVIIANKTPKEFVLNLDEDKQILKADEPSNFIIKPLDNFHIYLFDMFENSKLSRIGFKSDQNFKIVDFGSHTFDFKISDNQKSRLRLCNVENKSDFVDLIIETEVNYIDRIYKANFYTQEWFFSKSRIINLYFEIVVINRLEKHIVFNPLAKYFADESNVQENKEKNKKDDGKSSGKVLAVFKANKNVVLNEEDKKYENINHENDRKSNDSNKNNTNKCAYSNTIEIYKKDLENPELYSHEELEFFSKHRKSYLIRTEEIGVFSINDSNVRAKVKIGNSEYSNEFDFANDSLNKIPSFANTDKQFEFHCLIRTSYTFNFSKILILEPRYYVLNRTKLNLKYREVHFKQLKNSKNNNHDKNSNDNNNSTLNSKHKISNDKYYSKKINVLKPEEEKIFLLENQNYMQQGQKNLSKKDLENQKITKDTINSRNIHEFNFLQLFIDEKFQYDENSKAYDEVIEKYDDLGNNIYSEENRQDEENQENHLEDFNKKIINNNSEIMNQDQLPKWTSIINLDIDQDVDFKVEISEDFYLECKKKIKEIDDLLNDKDPREMDVEKLKKMRKIVDSNNIFTYDEKKFYILLRMTSRKYDNGLRYLIISEPKFPDLMLNNTTEYDVIINQVGSEEKVIVPKDTQKIIALSEIHDLKNENMSNLEIEIKELNIKSKINLKKIHDLIDLEANKLVKSDNKMKQDYLELKGSSYYAYIDTENSNITRVIKILEKNKMKEKSDFYMSDQLKNKSTPYIVECKLKGIGVSFLNMISQEYFYISFYKIKFKTSNNMIKSLNYINDKADINFKIYNIQVDYCKENLLGKKKIDRMYRNNYQTALKPKFQFIPYNEINIVKETFFPFIYLNIVTNTFLNSTTKQKTNKIAEIKFNIGEFDLTIDQNMLSSFLEILLEFSDEIDFNKKTTEKERDSPVDERLNLDSENKDENPDNENVNINQPKPLLLENDVSKAIDRGGYRMKGSIMNIKFFTEAYLKTVVESAEKKLIELNNDSIFYIENLVIYPIIFNVNTKVDITSIKLAALPISLQNLFGFFANSITNLTDLQICFEKVDIEDLYDRMNNILKSISTRYSNQVIGFIGDVITNTNLIGNPLKEIKKVKRKFDGIFDEDKELREKYGKEARKKLNSLFKITLEKGFDSVDKIIRNTLHLKNMKEENQKNVIITNHNGEEFDILENNKQLAQAGNVMEKGYKTDIEMHLVKSENNLIRGSIESAKEKDKFDLTKINVIFNPLSNVQNNLNQIDNQKSDDKINSNFQFNKQTSLLYAFANPVYQMYEKELNLDYNNMFDVYYSDKKGVNYDRPKIETNRFRHPRINLDKTYLRNYSYSEAEITMMLMTMFSKKFLKENQSNIIYTKNFFTYDDYLMEQYTSIIITEFCLLVITDAKFKKFDFEFKDLINNQIFEIENSNRFKINFTLRNGKSYNFVTKDFDTIYEIEKILDKIRGRLIRN